MLRVTGTEVAQHVIDLVQSISDVVSALPIHRTQGFASMQVIELELPGGRPPCGCGLRAGDQQPAAGAE